MQVVVNLLSNAANYSPRQSVVKLRVTVEAGTCIVQVIDHGVGIEPELQSRIFDLFVQSEQRLDRSRGGLGVGLSLARSIVDMHGGSIEVHSEGPGRGSTFRVAIPLGSRTRTAIQKPVRNGNRRRIVLVDDQADSREMLRMLLESRDHHVLDASDGPTAIEMIEREKPDIAFIDIGLPIMTGYEVAQQIRQRAHLSDVRLVALTGYGAPQDILAARAAGFDEHVIKPAQLAQIEQILVASKSELVD
jgi:CheY-like chemotaxis protein